jgi:hypothetical protein
MFIVRHKFTKFDGTAPVLQHGRQQLLPDQTLLKPTQDTVDSISLLILSSTLQSSQSLSTMASYLPLLT